MFLEENFFPRRAAPTLVFMPASTLWLWAAAYSLLLCGFYPPIKAGKNPLVGSIGTLLHHPLFSVHETGVTKDSPYMKPEK
jgi:hypothetical protein